MALDQMVDQVGLAESGQLGEQADLHAETDRLLGGEDIMIHEIDPLRDPRWPAFIRENPRASIFHTREWLEAVYRTYGYRPAALTTSSANCALTNGLVFGRVQSWLTGRRLVSFPFSDHCEPLVESEEELLSLFGALEERAQVERCRYVEVRPTTLLPRIPSTWRTSQSYYIHRLDLRPGADAVFRRFHRDCIQRRIRHAEREGIVVTEGRDPDTLRTFYNLVLQTRRRHGLPPQPRAWFGNIVDCLGEAATIHCAYQGGQPIAAVLTLRHAKSLYYKYGASVARFHRYGAMPYLVWHAIRDAIASGFEQLDMGRSDCDNLGLVTFKERWNAVRSVMSYLRSPADSPSPVYSRMWSGRLTRSACQHMPDRCLIALGNLSYRHID